MWRLVREAVHGPLQDSAVPARRYSQRKRWPTGPLPHAVEYSRPNMLLLESPASLPAVAALLPYEYFFRFSTV